MNGPGTQTPPRRPSPTLFFAHFVDHPACFTAFLGTVAQRRWGQTLDGVGGTVPNAIAVGAGEEEEAEKLDQAAVWNTLLELYLDEGIEGDQNAACKHHKALRLLQSTHLSYDLIHALVLCSSLNIRLGGFSYGRRWVCTRTCCGFGWRRTTRGECPRWVSPTPHPQKRSFRHWASTAPGIPTCTRSSFVSSRRPLSFSLPKSRSGIPAGTHRKRKDYVGTVCCAGS